MNIDAVISDVESGKDLSCDRASSVLRQIFLGRVSTDSLVSLLQALSQKGESVSEIVGFARVMRDELIPLQIDGNCIDVCGTGGSGRDRFNISTAVAFVLASLGVPVVKHGNRGSRKSNGSFDFLEALGLDLNPDLTRCQAQFSEYNLTFLFARLHHPGMKFVGDARRTVGCRTIFNILGPLCNPAGVTHQLLGTIDENVALNLAEALQILGTKRAFVVVGANGLDEFTVSGSSVYFDVSESKIERCVLDPAQYDLLCAQSVGGGLAEKNVSLFYQFLKQPNVESPLFRQIVLNVAMGMVCFGYDDSIGLCIQVVKEAILSKKVLQFVDTFLSA